MDNLFSWSQQKRGIPMLQQFLEQQLVEDGIPDTVVFQQDGTLSHFARIVRDYLNQTLGVPPSRFFVWGVCF